MKDSFSMGYDSKQSYTNFESEQKLIDSSQGVILDKFMKNDNNLILGSVIELFKRIDMMQEDLELVNKKNSTANKYIGEIADQINLLGNHDIGPEFDVLVSKIHNLLDQFLSEANIEFGLHELLQENSASAGSINNALKGGKKYRIGSFLTQKGIKLSYDELTSLLDGNLKNCINLLDKALDIIYSNNDVISYETSVDLLNKALKILDANTTDDIEVIEILKSQIKHNLCIIKKEIAKISINKAIIQYTQDSSLENLQLQLKKSKKLLLTAGNNGFQVKENSNESQVVEGMNQLLKLENIITLIESLVISESLIGINKILGDFSQVVSHIDHTTSSSIGLLKEEIETDGAIAKIQKEVTQYQVGIERIEEQINQINNKIQEIKNKPKIHQQTSMSGDMFKRKEKSLLKPSQSSSIESGGVEVIGTIISEDLDGNLDRLANIDFGNVFDDVIPTNKFEHFTITPPLDQRYYPTSIYDRVDTQRGTMVGGNTKMEDYSSDVFSRNKYIGKTTQGIIQLNLPQDYTVNTNSVHLSKNIAHKIVKDKYGFIYLILDNKDEEIYFSIDIGLTQDNSYKAKNAPEILYTGEYSQETQGMLKEIKENPIDYKTTKDKVDRVYRFIQDNFVYALDGNLNSIFDGYQNKIEAIENSYVDYSGEKKHPAVCNISAIMAVAYLRELGIHADFVSGYNQITSTRYVGHAWIRYYDEQNGSWENLDPTPYAMLREIKFDVPNENLQEGYTQYRDEMEEKYQIDELTQKLKIFEIEKQEISLQESQAIERGKDALRVKDERSQYNMIKLSNEQALLNSPQLLSNELNTKLQETFKLWKASFTNIKDRYYHEDNKDKKILITTQELDPFIQATLARIRSVADKAQNITNKDELFSYQVIFDIHLAMLEEIIISFPELDPVKYRGILETYKIIYGNDTSEKVSEIVGKLPNGGELIIVGNTIYLRDKSKSFVMKEIMDIAKDSNISDFNTNSDGSHWIFRAKNSLNGEYQLIKDGKVVSTKQGLGNITLRENGDFLYTYNHKLYLNNTILINKFDVWNEGLESINSFDSGKIHLIQNDKYIVYHTDEFGNNSDSVVPKSVIYVNNKILEDTQGNIIYFTDDSVILNNDFVLAITITGEVVLIGGEQTYKTIYKYKGNFDNTLVASLEDGRYVVTMVSKYLRRDKFQHLLVDIKGNISEISNEKANKLEFQYDTETLGVNSNNNQILEEINSADLEQNGRFTYTIKGKDIINQQGDIFHFPSKMTFLKQYGNFTCIYADNNHKQNDQRYLVNNDSGIILNISGTRTKHEYSTGYDVFYAGNRSSVQSHYKDIIFVLGNRSIIKNDPWDSSGNIYEHFRITDDGESYSYILNSDEFSSSGAILMKNGELIHEFKDPDFSGFRISNDLANYVYTYKAGGEGFIVKNGEIIQVVPWMSDVKFSQDLKHYTAVGLIKGKVIHYVDGVRVPIRGRNSDNDTEYNFQNQNPEDTSQLLDTLEQHRYFAIEEYLPKAIILLGGVIEGKPLDDIDKLFLIKNYLVLVSGINKQIFNENIEWYQNQAQLHLDEYAADIEQLKTGSKEDKSNAGQKEKTLQNINKALEITSISQQKIGEQIEAIMYDNIDLLFDERMNQDVRVKFIALCLSHSGDEEQIALIISKIKDDDRLKEDILNYYRGQTSRLINDPRLAKIFNSLLNS